MKSITLGHCPAPNYLHERSKEELTKQAINRFVEVAMEHDPAKRLVLQSERDLLRLEMLRIYNAEAVAGHKHSRRSI